MKRLHLHVKADPSDFQRSVDFYTNLFGAPTKLKPEYAKWMLDDPRMNFVVDATHGCGTQAGVHHVGVQVDDAPALAEMRARLDATTNDVLHVGETACCYSKSDKDWTTDPSGVRWEIFRTMEDVDVYGAKTAEEQASL